MASVILTISSARSDLVDKLVLDTSLPHKAINGLEKYFHSVNAGIESASVDIQTHATNPVAASGTWTVASVIATDEADVGGVALTFTATPTLETDVLVTIGSAKAFASSTDISLYTGYITETTHGYYTGDVARMTTSSVLPAGFALSTDYHIIKIDADTYALASSQANAVAGVPIVPTTKGTGNQTVTLTADKCIAYRLAAAVNAHSTLKFIVKATAALAVVTVYALQKGVVGNFIQFTDADSTITSSGSGYLAGGTGGAGTVPVNYLIS